MNTASPHKPETAARHLVRQVPRAQLQETAGAVRAQLAGQHFDSATAVYVLDEHERLLGLVPITALLAAPPGQALAGLLRASLPRVHPDMDQERVAMLADQHGLAAVPVTDPAGRLLGVVPPEALITILRREHIEDLHRLTGIRREATHARQAIESPPMRRARDRLPWLLVGLFGSMVATSVMAGFEQALQAHIAIAFFIPAVVYLADAVGTQTEAIAVRGLSLSRASLQHLLGGEVRTGLLMGSALGLIALPAVWLAFDDARLALAVALAILAASTAATALGLLLPWLLARLGQDPAFGSGPVATIIQDVLSLLIYLGIVHLLVL